MPVSTTKLDLQQFYPDELEIVSVEERTSFHYKSTGICAVIAIGLFFFIWSECLHYAFGKKKYLNELYDAEIKDMYVEADINFLIV